MSLKKKTDILKEEVHPKEAYLTGIAWANPDIFNFYSANKLSVSHLGNGVWKFYLGLARHMFDKGISVFDDITVASAVAELKLQDKYERYGGYETVEELMKECKDKIDNFEGYYNEVKKYALLREYRDLLGEKVIKPSGKYDYKLMSREQIATYWSDKINSIAMGYSESNDEEFDLLDSDELEAFIGEMDEKPDIGMPFYKSKKFTDMTNGWAYGTLSILSAFSGNGKSSFVLEKIVMSCIHEREKLLIVANEMDIKQYRKLFLVTAMGVELYEKFKDHFKNASFNRKNLNKGNFDPEEKEKLIMAVKWVKSILGGQNDLVKFIAMETYTMDNVEAKIRHYARRGYRRVIVDTAKPSEGGNANKARWEQFVEDFDRLYRLARKNGGGLDLALMATVQQADNMIGMKWLDERVIADGKKIKNISDCVLHFRPVHADELEGGSNELNVKQFIPASESFTGEYETVNKKLEHGKVYYLMFCSKNRRGMSNLTGLDPLCYSVDFNSNRWSEMGYATNVKKDNIM